jgi:ADP-dependent NAD(P)H-hydrate dehydratase / NAD(P)H-hydrate epimerase
MQKVLTAAQMREVDRRTTEEYGIPSILLMENAAHAVARVITEKLGGSVKGKSILILCGPGNNGGDGAALARILWKDGAHVVPALFGRIDKLSGDARKNFEALRMIEDDVATSGGEFNKLLIHDSDEDLISLVAGFLNDDETDVIVDALFGTGLRRPLTDAYPEVIQRLDIQGAKVIAIDVPSGLDSDQGEPIGPSITAATTVTFTAPKIANVIAPASRFNGELIVANIGSPQGLIDDQSSAHFVSERQDVQRWLHRTEFLSASYKNKRGHALLIAGSQNYSGAAVLAGDAAIRSGCGLVTLAVPESSRESVVARVQPEVMVRGISETAEGSASEKAIEEIKELLKNVDAVAIGSGLSRSDETAKFVRHIVEERKTTVVIDADGLAAFSPWRSNVLAANEAGGAPAVQSERILTPHEGEFRKLLGVERGEADEILKDRVAAVRDFATRNNVILVLKGERVLIGSPDGRVIVNPTGNSGLGKAGNGDTLTGILAGFVAQAVRMKIDMVETVVAACYVAGMAGDVAEKRYGKRVMTASDVRECLVEVFASLEAK